MSHPITLKAETGVIYAYACGICHHIAAPYELLGNALPGEFAEASLAAASECCLCRRCKTAQVPRGELDCAPCAKVETAEREQRAGAHNEQEVARQIQYNERLLKALDVDAAELLRRKMRDLSEEYYSAGWTNGLEHTLWRAVSRSAPEPFGHDGEGLSVAEIAALRRLSEKAGGWWVWDPAASMEMFVTLEAYRSAAWPGARDGSCS